jgi:hypothetical protein
MVCWSTVAFSQFWLRGRKSFLVTRCVGFRMQLLILVNICRFLLGFCEGGSSHLPRQTLITNPQTRIHSGCRPLSVIFLYKKRTYEQQTLLILVLDRSSSSDPTCLLLGIQLCFPHRERFPGYGYSSVAGRWRKRWLALSLPPRFVVSWG